MSYASFLDRRVTLQPMDAPLGKDELGNERYGPGDPVEDRPARREQVGADEDIVNRDRQERRFRYFLLAGPAELALTGHDQIIDVDGTYEIDGQPDHVSKRRGIHHVEAIAYKVKG